MTSGGLFNKTDRTNLSVLTEDQFIQSSHRQGKGDDREKPRLDQEPDE